MGIAVTIMGIVIIVAGIGQIYLQTWMQFYRSATLDMMNMSQDAHFSWKAVTLRSRYVGMSMIGLGGALMIAAIYLTPHSN